MSPPPPYLTQLINMNHTLCPQNSAPTISPGQKWWPTFLEIEVSCTQWEGSTCAHHDGPSFFLLGWGGWSFIFLGFLPCSQCVLIMFSQGSLSSQVVLQKVHNHTSILSHMVCPKFNSHVYKLKGKLRVSIFAFTLQLGSKEVLLLSPKRCFYWEVHNAPRKLVMGQSMLVPSPKKLIN